MAPLARRGVEHFYDVLRVDWAPLSGRLPAAPRRGAPATARAWSAGGARAKKTERLALRPRQRVEREQRQSGSLCVVRHTMAAAEMIGIIGSASKATFHHVADVVEGFLTTRDRRAAAADEVKPLRREQSSDSTEEDEDTLLSSSIGANGKITVRVHPLFPRL